MRNICQRIKDLSLIIAVMIVTSPVLADIPKPPDKDLANSTNDWGDVTGSIAFKFLGYAFIIVGAIILLCVAGNIYKSYNVAHDKQDLGHFFKHSGAGVVCVVIAIALLYSGYHILPSQSM